MPVPLIDDRLAVGLRRERARQQFAGIETQAHRATFIRHVALLGQQVDHWMAGKSVELRAVGVSCLQPVAAELNHGTLHSETETQVGGKRGAGESGRGNLPLDTAMSESARDHDAVHLVERAQISRLECFGGDPLDVDA